MIVTPKWYAVDGRGMDLATGRPPLGPGAPSPAAALASAPIVPWPFSIVDGERRRVPLAVVVGPGGEAVERLLSGLVTPTPPPARPRLMELARATPGGRQSGPVRVVSPAEAAVAAGDVDPPWTAVVGERREAARHALDAASRNEHLEAALHAAMLLGVEHLPAYWRGVDVRAASGAQLWLLGGMVTAALAGPRHAGGFAPWAELLAAGLWPIGPVAGTVVIGDTRR